jgi:hypothetical protein
LTPKPTALHIRTGDPGAGEAIDAWLTASGFDALNCADAYEACVHLLRRAEQVPELIFIGVDWLAPDEHEILRYARETWPAVGMVIYGAPQPPSAARLPLSRCCGSRAELAALLAESAGTLIDRFARAAGAAAEAGVVADSAAAPRGAPLRPALAGPENHDR